MGLKWSIYYLDAGVNKEILCIHRYRIFHKIVQSNSQTTSRIGQLSVHAKKEIITLENVWKWAIKLVPCLRDPNYHIRLKKLNLPTLVYRRLRGDMIEIVKIVSGAYGEQMMPAIATTEKGFYQRRGHNCKLPRNHNKIRMRQHYFRERITCSWNSLPDKVVEAASMQSFERKLDKHWRDQYLIFNYETALRLGHKANYDQTVPNFCSQSDEDLDTRD